MSFLECIQDRPSGRPALSALAHGDVWNCLGFSDPEGLTRIDSNVYRMHTQGGGHSHSSHSRRGNRSALIRDLFRQGEGSQYRSCLTKLWQYMCEQADDEVIRVLLFRTWIHLFGHTVPAVFTKKDADKETTTAIIQSLKKKLWEGGSSTDASVVFKQERLIVRDPFESHNKCEMILRHGRTFKPPAAVSTDARSRQSNVTSSIDHRKSTKSMTHTQSSKLTSDGKSSSSGSTGSGTGLKLSFKPSVAKHPSAF